MKAYKSEGIVLKCCKANSPIANDKLSPVFQEHPCPALLYVLFSALRVEIALENADDIPDSRRWWFGDRAS